MCLSNKNIKTHAGKKPLENNQKHEAQHEANEE